MLHRAISTKTCSNIALIAKAQETPSPGVETADPSPFLPALSAPGRHRNVEIDPKPVLGHLIVRPRHALRRPPDGPPVHARVPAAVPQHHPHRLGGLGVVRAAAGARVGQHLRAAGQVAAEVAGRVAGGLAAVGEAVAEGGPRLHDDGIGTAVEEEEVVLGGEGEAGAGVEGEGRRGRDGEGAEGVVGAGEHGRVGEDEMGIGVGEGADRVGAGGGSEEEITGGGGGVATAGEEVAVVGAAAAVVHAERVRDGDVAARGAAETGLCIRDGGGDQGKEEEAEENHACLVDRYVEFEVCV